MIKLKPEFKAKWVAALRSGKWISRPGCLGKTDTNERCCLGVALEVLGMASRPKRDGSSYLGYYNVPADSVKVEEAEAEAENADYLCYSVPGPAHVTMMRIQEEYYPPLDGLEWSLEIGEDFPKFTILQRLIANTMIKTSVSEGGVMTICTSLTELNDSHIGFPMIADIIEFYG